MIVADQIYGTLNYINIQGFKYAALRANVNLSEDWEWASFTRHVSLLQPCKTSNCPTIETNMGPHLAFPRKTFQFTLKKNTEGGKMKRKS